MPDAPVKVRLATREHRDALVEQLARVTAQIAEFEARPQGRSAVLAALRKHRDELTRVEPHQAVSERKPELTRADIDEFAEAIFKLASGGVATREAEVLAQRYRNAARRFADTTASPEFEYRRLLREAMAQLEPRPGFSQGRRREVLNRARAVLSNALRRNDCRAQTERGDDPRSVG